MPGTSTQTGRGDAEATLSNHNFVVSGLTDSWLAT